MIPAVAALSAYVLERLWSAGQAAPWQRVRRFTTPAMLAILAMIFYMNVDFYFDEQANDPRVFAAFSTDETLIAQQPGRASETGTFAVGVAPVFALAHRQPAG